MRTIEQDITKITEGVVFQQVNCLGVMGAGLAAQLALKHPSLLPRYRTFIHERELDLVERFGVFDSSFLLGEVFVYEASSDLSIVNLFAQDKVGGKATCYKSLYHCLHKAQCSLGNAPKYFPFGLGCGLGGGNWVIVSALIGAYFPDAVVCKPPFGPDRQRGFTGLVDR